MATNLKAPKAGPLVCFYRISDNAQNAPSGEAVSKVRPAWFNKRACFSNFVSNFGVDKLFVVADSCSDTTLSYLRRYVPNSRVICTSYKSGAYSFLHAARLASMYPDETKILLCEDDYVWLPDSKECIIQGLDIADYVTPYDASDKYVNAGTIGANGCVGNPLIQDRSETTRVFLTETCHWKETNSTTMTWAATAKTIKKDLNVYNAFCNQGFPHDYAMFRHLITQGGRRLVSPIPSKATHCELAYLSPLIDWQNVLKPFQDDV